MKKKIFYVRMEAIGYVDFKVLASNKKEAAKTAEDHRHLASCNCDGFEAGEVLEDNPWDDYEQPTEEDPVISMQ